MRKLNGRRARFSVDANKFRRPDDFDERDDDDDNRPLAGVCRWDDCPEPMQVGLPVCVGHAWAIARICELPEREPSRPLPKFQPFVYYLMVGPATVKIGTTTALAQRIAQLRSDLQYVVALELGGREIETERHKRFAVERIGRREDFRLSDRLKKHIETLQPKRDELVEFALTHPELPAA